MDKVFKMIENYIYLYHVEQFVIIPCYPESINDSMGVTFASTTPIARSAPIYSYSNSGPRVVQIDLKLHRDMMTQVNTQRSNLKLEIGDDYVDTLIKQLQAIALPKYAASSKMVDPPLVAVRFGNDIFCKGIVTGNVATTYQLPILTNDKYSQVDISFQVYEVDPYDANSVMKTGSFRGLDTSLERNLWRA